MKQTKRIVGLFLAAIMLMGMLAGCTPKDDTTTAPPSGGGTTTAPQGGGTTTAPQAGDGRPEGAAKEQVVKLYYSSEISDWNPMHPSSGTTWANWIDTLVEYDNYGMCQPCLAESWTKSDDGLTWTFKIREGVQWQYHDGKEYGAEVTAEDWVTTCKWILDPTNTARTADLLFDIVGAEDYYLAMETDPLSANWDAVGIRAISKYELEFTLMAPCSYFLSRLTYNWGYPTNGQYLEEQGDRFGTSHDTLLYCGAFLVSAYEANSYIIHEANPMYWDKENIHVERIEERYNAEARTLAPEALLRGEVTYASIPAEQLDGWMTDPAKSELIRPSRPSTYSYWYLINCMPTYTERSETIGGVTYTLSHDQWLKAANNINFRKSLYYGLDRIKALTTYNPYTPEEFVLRTITPQTFAAADGKDYTELDPLLPFSSVDQFQSDKALQYRDTAIAELTAAGVSFPIVAYMPYQTDSTQVDLTVIVSQQLEALLGTDYIKFILEGYPPTDYLSTTRRAGNYSFMMSYWGPDYADPQTWTDPFALGQAYNYIWHAEGMATQTTVDDPDGRMGRSGFDETYWKNSTYDMKLKEAAKETVDSSKRFNAFAELEAWLLDQAFVIPLGMLNGIGYLSSCMNPFESQFAPFGISDERYKYQWVYEKPMSTEQYLEQLPIWEAERARRIEEAQAKGIDY